MSNQECCNKVLQEVQKYFFKLESRLKNIEGHLQVMQWIMTEDNTEKNNGTRDSEESSKNDVEKNKETSEITPADTSQNKSPTKRALGTISSVVVDNGGFINRAMHGSTSKSYIVTEENTNKITDGDSGVFVIGNHVRNAENDCEVIPIGNDTNSENECEVLSIGMNSSIPIGKEHGNNDVNALGLSETNQQQVEENSFSGKRKACPEETNIGNENRNTNNEGPVAKQLKVDDLDNQNKKAAWMDIFKLLQPEHSDEITWRLLLQACIDGLPIVVSFLLEISPKSRHDAYFTMKNEAGLSLLTLAAQGGHHEVVKVLVDSGINLQHSINILALLEAAEHGNVGVVEVLIDAGVNPSIANKMGSTALHLAARGGHVQVITALTKGRANPSARDELGRTPLHEAAIGGDACCVNALLSEKINKEAKDQAGYTALHYAAERNQTKIIEALIAAQVNVYACDAEGRTALHTAAVAGSVGALHILMEEIHNLAYDRRGRTALHLAAKSGHTEVVEMLLPTIYYVGYDKDGLYPVHCAAQLGHTEIIDILLCAGESASKRDCAGRTPLHHAVNAGCIKTVKLLLSEESNVDAQDTNGRTPLHQAAENGNEEITWALLDGGACAFSCDNLYYSPLHLAAKAGHSVVMKALMGAGASPEVQRYKETPSPLQLAATNKHSEAVRVLLNAGAKPANKEILTSLQELLPDYDWSEYINLK